MTSRGRASIYALIVVGVLGGLAVWLWPRSVDTPSEPAPSPERPPQAALPAESAEPAPTIAPEPTPSPPGASATPTPTPKPLPPPSTMPPALQGLALRGLDTVDRERLKLPERLWGGVVVTDVDPRSSAAEARLAPNDVIFRANGKKILSTGDLAAAVDGRTHTKIQVYRGGSPFEVVLHPPYEPGRPE